MKIGEVRELQASLVRILVVDDSAVWQAMVQTQMEQHPNLLIIGLASDGMEAIQKADRLQPDLIVLDVGMPVLNGVEAARQIQRLAPGSVILFLSENTDPDVLLEALCVGGRGFVLKSEATRDLVPAIEAVLGGERFISPELIDYDTWT